VSVLSRQRRQTREDVKVVRLRHAHRVRKQSLEVFQVRRVVVALQPSSGSPYVL